MAVPTRWKATEDEEKQIDEFMLALNKWILTTYHSDKSDEYWSYMVKCADAIFKKYPVGNDKPLFGVVFGFLEGMSAKQTGKDLHWSIEEKLHSTVTDGKSGGGREEA